MEFPGLKFHSEVVVRKNYPIDSMFMGFFAILFIILIPLFYNSSIPAMTIVSGVGALMCLIKCINNAIPDQFSYPIAIIEEGLDWERLIRQYQILHIWDEENRTFVMLQERE